MKRKKILSVACVLLCIVAGSFAVDAEAVKAPSPEKLKIALGEFEAYAKKGMADWKVPGMAIAIVQGDAVIYEKAFGVKTLGQKEPVTTDTVFQIGSTSKAFTAALVGMLVDEGKVKWDDPVVDHLDDFMMYDSWVTRQFTVTDLMAQHSGMPEHAGDTAAIIGFDRAHIIGSIRFIKPVTSFRSAYAYQNNLFLVTAKLIEKHTGKSWEENIRQRIFKPLGMTASSVDMASFKAGKDVATLHHLMDGKIVILPMSWPSMDWVYTYAPAGGINSNVKDVAKWIRMQMNGGSFDGKQLITRQSVQHMHTPETVVPSTPPVTRQYYCQGWVYREACPYPIIWHNGGTSGSKTMIAFIPQAGVGIVVLSNLIETPLPESLAFRFFDIYFGNPVRDWSKEALERVAKEEKEAKSYIPKPPAEPALALPLEKYTGDYSNDIYGKLTVLQKDRTLVAVVGPKGTEILLRHFERDIFIASWDVYIEREDAGFARFDIGPDGVAESVTIEALNTDGCGVFQKAK